ncbi:MAG TPA: hypothetical protein VKQ52_08235, partial [Puia sp.]|nr:hypothetical protein [Puia sp.]
DLLLRKRASPGRLKETGETSTTEASLGEEVRIKRSNGIQFTQIFVSYNRKGYLARALYQPPVLRITFTLENGQTLTQRAIKPILSDGVILNKYIDSRDEFRLLMQTGGHLNTNVRSVRIDADPADWGFVKKIQLVTRYYLLTGATGVNEDSLALAGLTREYEQHPPRLIDPGKYIADSIRTGMDVSTTSSFFLRAEGWAFREKGDNHDILVQPVVRSGDKVYELSAEKRQRPDLFFAFNRRDLDNAGFESSIMQTQLPPGQYQAGVAIYDHHDGKQYLGYTDHFFTVLKRFAVEGGGRTNPRFINKGNLQMAIDSIVDREDQVLIKGWAFIKGVGSTSSAGWLILRGGREDYRIPVQTLPSEKVTGYFNDPRYGNCGFMVVVSKAALPEGVYTLGIGMAAGSKDTTVLFDDRRLYIDTAESPAKIAGQPPVKDFPSGIDEVKDEKDFLTLSGWAVAEQDTIDDDAIDIVLLSGDAIFIAPTQMRSRPDVKAALKSRLNADNSGFFAKIPKAGLPAGKYRLGLYLHHGGGQGVMKFIDQGMVKE